MTDATMPIDDFAAKVLAGARAGIEPHVDAWEAAAHTPVEPLLEFAAEFGLTALTLPASRGGTPRPWRDIVRIARVMGRVYRALGFVLVNNIVASYLAAVATDAQWARWGRPVAAAETLSVLALTEPQAGNDLGAVDAEAVPADGGFRLNGVKSFVPNADQVEFALVAARLGKERPPSMFVIEPNGPGVTTTRMGPTLALRGVHLCEIHLDDAFVPSDHMLGEEDGGLSQLWPHLQGSRLNTSGLAVGGAEEALDLAVAYATRTKRFGGALVDNGAVQQRLADMAIGVETAARYLDHAAAVMDEGSEDLQHALSVAKVLSTDSAMRVTTDAVQLLGGWGYLESHKVERLMREAKLNQIVDGANDIHRTLIARYLGELG